MNSFGHFCFHLTAAVIMAYGIYYDVYRIVFPEDFKRSMVPFAGRWKYLTFWNANIQFAYFSFAVLNDLFGSSSVDKKDCGFLQTIRDFLFGSILHTLAMFVSLSFWGIWAVDRELIFPKALDSFFPSWLNHVLHTAVLVFAVIEMVLVPKTFPSRKSALVGLISVMLGYLLWVFYIAYRTNFWVYPVLAVLNWGFRALFLLGLMLVSFILYYITEKLHFSIWGYPAAVKSKPAKESVKNKPKAAKPAPRKKGKQN